MDMDDVSAPAREYSRDQLERMASGEPTLLEEEMPARPAPVPGGEQSPRLWLITAGSVLEKRIPSRQLVYTLGASREDADAQLFDHSIGQRQLAIIHLGGDWVLADCGSRDLTAFNGVAARQLVCSWPGRAIARVGRGHVIFLASDGDRPSPRYLPARFRCGDAPPRADTVARACIRRPGAEAASSGEPLLLGRHPLCDLTFAQPDVEPFHAMLCWDAEGVHLRPLTEAAVTVDRVPAEEFTGLPVETDCELCLGSATATLRISGDAAGRGAELVPEQPVPLEQFVLHPVNAPHVPPLTVPAFGGPQAVGRSASCDLEVPDHGISRVHAQIIPSGKSFYLIDNYSSNGSFVNGQRVNKARCRAGDLVELAEVAFVVHYA